MTRLTHYLVLIAILLTLGLAARAASHNYTVPKREFRSAWVATVWCLDWPETQAYGTNAEAKQKAQLDRMLDSLKNNNFNAINFQVRSMCDAMYESSYEPWSSYLTGTRGQVPTWDVYYGRDRDWRLSDRHRPVGRCRQPHGHGPAPVGTAAERRQLCGS